MLLKNPAFFLSHRLLSGVSLSLALILTGCNEPNAATETSVPAVPETVSAEEPNAVISAEEEAVAVTPEESLEDGAEPVVAADENSVLADVTVSEKGLGIARLGMTLGELRDALPELEFTTESPFIVDFDAIAVRDEGEALFYILHLAGSPLNDDAPIQGLLTDNPMFKTAESVGVGTPISAAEITYGKAVLSYNTGNESREYVRFEDHPATNISFGTQGNVLSQPDASSTLSGIYDEQSAQYNETEVYHAEAAIEAILVVCLSAACSE